MITISEAALCSFPDVYRIEKMVHDEKDMFGKVHKNCVILSFYFLDNYPTNYRRGLFDADTGEYISEI